MLHTIIRELRERAELTQGEVAERLKISRTAYAMYETNKRQMSQQTLCLLADFYHVTVDYLLGRKEQDAFALIDKEKAIITQYRGLDERAKENVRAMMAFEHSRKESKDKT